MATKTQAKARAKAKAKGEADSLKERGARFLDIARKAFEGESNWMRFSNAIYGIGGPFSQLFPTQEDRAAFQQTPEHAEVERMMSELQGGEDDEPLRPVPAEGQARFVLRLPRSMFEALRAEAEAEGVSINVLCIAKLGTKLRDNCFLKC
jgi:predicted HicB family RNase H-like nuclease